MCVHHVYRGQKSVDSLELQLEVVVTLYEDSGNQTWVIWKSSQFS